MAKEKSASAPGAPLFDKLNTFLEGKGNIILIISLAFTALFSYLLFDGRMSFATDDAEYIKRAYNYMHLGHFPAYQGPLYPVMLTIMLQLFGMKVMLFKAFSALCLLGQVFFLYKAFFKRIPAVILTAILLYISISHFFLYYGSYTFNEAFLFFIQALAFWFFMRHIDVLKAHNALKDTWKSWLLFGLGLFLVSITKNILIVAVGAAVLYFLLYKEWKNAGLAVAAFAVFKLPYEIITRALYGVGTTEQLDQILRKDFYDPSKGYEDTSGFIQRFTENFSKFFSVHFYRLLGIRAEDTTTEQGSIIFGFIFIALVIFAFIILLRNSNRYSMFSLLYGIAAPATMLIALQTIWAEQERLLLPFMPFLLIGIFGGLYYFLRDNKRPAALRMALVGLLGIIVLIQFSPTMKKVSDNGRPLKRYMKGDMTYGFPPQIKNFLEVCQWTENNISDSALIATGKPSEAFVYSKSDIFARISRPAPGETPDQIMERLKKDNITHLMLDAVSGAAVYLNFKPVYDAQPERLNLVYQKGEGETACYLFELRYK